VAEREGSIVGSVLLFPPAADAYGGAAGNVDCPEVRLLAVAPDARGQGIGGALMEECARRARRGRRPPPAAPHPPAGCAPPRAGAAGTPAPPARPFPPAPGPLTRGFPPPRPAGPDLHSPRGGPRDSRRRFHPPRRFPRPRGDQNRRSILAFRRRDHQ